MWTGLSSSSKTLASDQSSAKEILQIACRPDDDTSPPEAEPAFSITLSRYAFEGDRWQVYTRTKKGFWENDVAFPPRAQFP